MLVWMVVWIVLMILWLFSGCYMSWEPTKPHMLGNTLIPWICVLILGLVVFGAVGGAPIKTYIQ